MFLLDCEEERAKERISHRNAKRTDDNPVSVDKKIETYKSETLPVLKRYLNQ